MTINNQYSFIKELIELVGQVKDKSLKHKLLEKCDILTKDLEFKYVSEQHRCEIQKAKEAIGVLHDD